MKKSIRNYKGAIESAASTPIATRQQATFITGFLNALPNPDPILRKTGKRIKVYRELLGDWEAFAAVELVHAGLQDLEWQLEQGDAEKAAFEAFEERFRAWDIKKIMSEAVDGRNFGYQPFEFIWENTADGWQISDIVGKPPEWFNFSGENQLQFKSTAHPMGQPVPAYQFGVATHRESYQNPYGEAALSRIFWPIAFKKGGVEFWTKFLEKYAVPWVVGKEPRGTKKKSTNDFLDQLENMVQDAVAVIPDDSSVDIQEASGKAASTDAFTSYAWYFDAAINKVILSSETAMSVSKEGSDVRGNSAEHSKASKSVMRAIGGMAEKVINQAIRWEWHFNHEGPAPVFSVYEPTDVQKDRSDRDNNLNTQGVRFTAEYYKKHYGLSDDEFKLTDPQPPQGQPGFAHKGTSLFTDAEKKQSAQNQRILEEMIEGAGGEDAAGTNQALMETLLKPVIDLVNTAGSMEEVIQKMAAQFPEMDTKQLEQRIERALFLTDTWGRLTAAEEDNADES